MRTYTLHCELLVKRPLKETFAFFENPANLAKITPPWLSFNIITKGAAMGENAQFDYLIKLFGIPMKWRSLITKYDPPFSFADEQLIGPYKTWHHEHTFVQTTNGIKVGDHLQYTLPMGPLGAIAQELMVKHQLNAVFRYRQTALAKIFPGDTELLVPPAIV